MLIAPDETSTNITQIAVTTLKQGEIAEKHSHQTMEEFFFILEGRLRITIGECDKICQSGDFIRVKASTPHSIKALTECRMMTIGCAVDSE